MFTKGSLHFLPEGTLAIIGKIYFQFLWMGDNNKINFSSPCRKIKFPKELGGWEITNLHSFAIALAAKKCFEDLKR